MLLQATIPKLILKPNDTVTRSQIHYNMLGTLKNEHIKERYRDKNNHYFKQNTLDAQSTHNNFPAGMYAHGKDHYYNAMIIAISTLQYHNVTYWKCLYQQSGAEITDREQEIRDRINYNRTNRKGIYALYNHTPSKCTTYFLLNRTAESATLVRRVQIIVPHYNWNLIMAIRTRKWTGKMLNQNNTKHKCECGEQCTLEHLMLCESLTTARIDAAENVFKAWNEKHTYQHIDNHIYNIKQIIRDYQPLVQQFINSHNTSPELNQLLTTTNLDKIMRMKNIFDMRRYITLHRFNQKERANTYMERCKTNTSLEPFSFTHQFKKLTNFMITINREKICLDIPTRPQQIETYIQQLCANKNINHLHSPPCEGVSPIYGFFNLMFLGEFLNSIPQILAPWNGRSIGYR